MRLHDPVGEDLGRGRLEPPARVSPAQLRQPPGLGNAAIGVHVERGQDPDRELPGAVEGRVGVEESRAGAGLDDRRDAVPVGQGLPGLQSFYIVLRAEVGDEPVDQAGRALAEGPARLARPRVALDAAAGRVRGGPGDAGQRPGPASCPGGMAVGRGEQGRTVGHGGVQVLLARVRLREEGQVPAAPGDPRGAGMGRGVVADLGHDLVLRPEPVEVAEAELDAAGDEVDVRILEGRQDHAPAEVDDPGGRAAQPERPGAAAGEDDLAAGHGQGLGPGRVRGHGDGPWRSSG